MAAHPGSPENLSDQVIQPEVCSSRRVFDGLVWNVRRDVVELADGQVVTRDVLEHPGAVGVIALDEQDRVLLVRQYRHPVRSYLWEAPAGLLDVNGEEPLAAAQRELAEEAGLLAGRWHVLVDFYNSPGGSSETFRCYLARDLRPAQTAHMGDGEERDMPLAWVGLDEAQKLVLSGKLHNPTTVAGVLAANAARESGWSTLRSASSPWTEGSVRGRGRDQRSGRS